jgi:hypothetical protein
VNGQSLVLRKERKSMLFFQSMGEDDDRVSARGSFIVLLVIISLIYSDIINNCRLKLGKFMTKAKVNALIATKPKTLHVDDDCLIHPDELDDWIEEARKKMVHEGTIDIKMEKRIHGKDEKLEKREKREKLEKLEKREKREKKGKGKRKKEHEEENEENEGNEENEEAEVY